MNPIDNGNLVNYPNRDSLLIFSRLAQRVRELKQLPAGLSDMPSIKSVINLYEDSFWRIREFPFPKSSSEEESFTEVSYPPLLNDQQ